MLDLVCRQLRCLGAQVLRRYACLIQHNLLRALGHPRRHYLLSTQVWHQALLAVAPLKIAVDLRVGVLARAQRLAQFLQLQVFNYRRPTLVHGLDSLRCIDRFALAPEAGELLLEVLGRLRLFHVLGLIERDADPVGSRAVPRHGYHGHNLLVEPLVYEVETFLEQMVLLRYLITDCQQLLDGRRREKLPYARRLLRLRRGVDRLGARLSQHLGDAVACHSHNTRLLLAQRHSLRFDVGQLDVAPLFRAVLGKGTRRSNTADASLGGIGSYALHLHL